MSSPPARRRRIETEELGDITVVTFLDTNVFGGDWPIAIGDDLFRLVDELGRRKVLLDCGNLPYVSSLMLGKVITLHRKLQAVRGRLVLSNISKDILDVFRITKLDKIIAIVAGSPAAGNYPALFDTVRPPSVAFSPGWRTDTVLSLAKHTHESRDFDAMPILADALQDAGCDSADILNHCRGPGPHVRGCWVIDLVLGNE